MILELLLLYSVGQCLCVNVELLKPYDEFATHMFQSSDTDHDGSFTLQELEAEFDKYDINHDHYVSRHEYTAYVCFMQPVLYQLSHYLFDQYDISPVDHKLARTDFDAFFRKLDANHDGTISQTEWVTWWVHTFQSLEGAGHHQHGNSEEHGSQHCM